MSYFGVVAIIIGMLISGCSVTKDGVKIPVGTGPSKADLDDFVRRNDIKNQGAQPATTSGQSIANQIGKKVVEKGVKKAVLESDNEMNGKAKIIIIGNTMALYEFSEKQVNSRYDVYEKNMKAANLPITMSREWYTSNIVGAVNLKIGGIPGVYAQMHMVELDKEIKEKINFPSTLSTLMFQTSSDLVAAEDDGVRVLQVTKILCAENQSDFRKCSDKYERGVFQGKDGLEIDSSLKIKENGAKIDVINYQKL